MVQNRSILYSSREEMDNCNDKAGIFLLHCFTISYWPALAIVAGYAFLSKDFKVRTKPPTGAQIPSNDTELVKITCFQMTPAFELCLLLSRRRAPRANKFLQPGVRDTTPFQSVCQQPLLTSLQSLAVTRDCCPKGLQ